jgi:hypothetical protein
MPPEVRPGSLLPQPANAMAKPQQIVTYRFMVISLERGLAFSPKQALLQAST